MKAVVSKSVLESGALVILLLARLLQCFLLSLWLYLLMLMLNCP